MEGKRRSMTLNCCWVQDTKEALGQNGVRGFESARALSLVGRSQRGGYPPEKSPQTQAAIFPGAPMHDSTCG